MTRRVETHAHLSFELPTEGGTGADVTCTASKLRSTDDAVLEVTLPTAMACVRFYGTWTQLAELSRAIHDEIRRAHDARDESDET